MMFTSKWGNDDGTISRSKAEEMLINELHYSKERAQYVAKQFDKNKDGKLTAKELERFKNSVKQTKRDLMAAFASHDSDNDGLISFDEAKRFLQEPPFNFPLVKINALLSRFDKDGNGHLDCNEFMAFYPEARASQEEILRQFEQLDVDGEGGVPVNDMVDVIRQLTGYDEEQARYFITSMDDDQDGYIDMKEFTAIWTLMFG